MRVRVLYFGVLREQRPAQEEEVELAEGACVADLVNVLRRSPSNEPVHTIWDRLAVAINREYASAADALCEGDEVALLPPVSGGTDAHR
jgi:molybdopterin converting factor subunit 1